MTGGGAVVSGLGLSAYLAGWQLGWLELLVLAAGCLLALLAALPFVVGRTRLELERRVQPRRVVAGETAVAVLAARNTGRTPTAPRVVEDRVGGGRLLVELPALGPGGTTEAVYPLPTGRRGRIEIGPAVIVKADPLGLLRRDTAHTGTDTLWVHPRTTALQPLPVGFAKDLEGPTTDTSPAGDVAFHALRPYVVGDDFRHIHWMSSARSAAGSLLVRQYVDNRRPHLAVLVDPRPALYGPEGFEVAVEVAASLALSSMVAQQPLALRIGGEVVVGQHRRGGRDDVLDHLAVVQPDPAATPQRLPSLAPLALALLRAELGSSALVVITGRAELEDLMGTVQVARRFARVLAVRVWPPGERRRGVLPGARLFDVEGLEEFRRAWNGVGA